LKESRRTRVEPANGFPSTA